MKAKKKPLIIAGVILIVLIVVAFSIPFIKFIKDPEKLRNFIDSFGIFSSLVYVLLVVLQILLPFIPGEPFELFAGYAFGHVEGFFLCFFAESLSSIIIIFLTRKLGQKFVENFFPKDKIKKLSFLKSKKAFVLYTIIFIMPGTPKDLLCYFGGLANFDLVPLILVTTLGRIPSILTSVITGGAFGSENYKLGIIVYAITFAISLFGLLIYNTISKNKNK